MALVKTWYTPEEAEGKFGVKKEKILAWAEEGLVRFEREGDLIARVNIDDVQLQTEEMLRES